MSQLSAGQKVKVTVTFTMNDGTVVPASPNNEPMEMTVGQETGFKPIDDTLPTLSVGESKKLKLSPEEAFGMPDANLVMEIPRAEIQTDEEITVGMQMQMQTPEGQTMVAMIHDVTDTFVKVDANHPLAGEELDFEITVVS